MVMVMMMILGVGRCRCGWGRGYSVRTTTTVVVVVRSILVHEHTGCGRRGPLRSWCLSAVLVRWCIVGVSMHVTLLRPLTIQHAVLMGALLTMIMMIVSNVFERLDLEFSALEHPSYTSASTLMAVSAAISYHQSTTGLLLVFSFSGQS